jgi:hypothetical protein
MDTWRGKITSPSRLLRVLCLSQPGTQYQSGWVSPNLHWNLICPGGLSSRDVEMSQTMWSHFTWGLLRSSLTCPPTSLLVTQRNLALHQSVPLWDHCCLCALSKCFPWDQAWGCLWGEDSVSYVPGKNHLTLILACQVVPEVCTYPGLTHSGYIKGPLLWQTHGAPSCD